MTERFPIKPTVAILNMSRINYDSCIDLEPLRRVGECTFYCETRPDQIVDRAAGHDVLVTKEIVLTAEVILNLPERVRLICEAGTGYDNIDRDAATAAGLQVCNVPRYSTASVAELAVCFILMLSKGVGGILRRIESGNHDDFYRRPHGPLVDVRGKTLGVVGAGLIGREVIRLAHALGMRAVVYSRSAYSPRGLGVRNVELAELLQISDFVSLHCPLSDATRHLINASTLPLMKPEGCLVNTARGGLVDHDALLTALKEGRLGGVALDVQDPEPLPEGHALWGREDVLLSPHIGWQSREARQRLVDAVSENIRSFGKYGVPVHLVSPDV